jgi:hypothetical protein
MKTANFATSYQSCRNCRYYHTEGRRGGMCNQLSVSVQGEWPACSLAARPFNTAWESLEEVVRLEHSLSLSYQGDEQRRDVSSEALVEEKDSMLSSH